MNYRLDRFTTLPELMYPGKKPLSPTQLDYSGVFNKNLFWWPITETSGERIRGFVRNDNTGQLAGPKNQTGVLDVNAGTDISIKAQRAIFNQSANDTDLRSQDGIDALGDATRDCTFIVRAKAGAYVNQGSSYNTIMAYARDGLFLGIDSAGKLVIAVAGTFHGYSGCDWSDGVHTAGISYRGTTTEVYWDGVKQSSDISHSNYSVSSANLIAIGSDGVGLRYCNCEVELAGVWTRGLSEPEHRSIHLDPYQNHYHKHSYHFVSDVSGGISIDGIPASLNLSGQAGQVDLGSTIDATPAILNLTGVTGEVSVGTDILIDGSPATININGLSGQVDQGVGIDGLPASINLTGITGDVSLSLDVLIDGIPATMSLTGITGDVSLVAGDTLINGVPANISITGIQGSLVAPEPLITLAQGSRIWLKPPGGSTIRLNSSNGTTIQ